MAKKVAESDTSADKGGMRILYVELNGSNASLQEGLRTLVAAMNKPAQPAPASPRRIVANTHTEPAEANEAQGDLFPQAETEEDAAGESGSPDGQPPSNGSTRRPRGEGPKKDRNAGIELVTDIDLIQEGGTSLSQFYGQKAPGTAEEKLAVFAYYLKHNVKVSPIGPGHLMTCFKDVGQKVPLSLKDTIRQQSAGKGWLTCADMNDLKLTTAGENYVKHTLGKADSANKSEGK